MTGTTTTSAARRALTPLTVTSSGSPGPTPTPINLLLLLLLVMTSGTSPRTDGRHRARTPSACADNWRAHLVVRSLRPAAQGRAHPRREPPPPPARRPSDETRAPASGSRRAPAHCHRRPRRP